MRGARRSGEWGTVWQEEFGDLNMVAVASPFRRHICVLGLGNLMRSEDAVGVLTTRFLECDELLPWGAETLEGGTLGLDLLGRLDGISHLLVLDAVDVGAIPGTLLRFEGKAMRELPTAKSVHLLGLSDLMNVLRLMDEPEMEVVLLGVQPESTDWGTSLTPAVEAVQGLLIEAAVKQVRWWTVIMANNPVSLMC